MAGISIFTVCTGFFMIHIFMMFFIIMTNNKSLLTHLPIKIYWLFLITILLRFLFPIEFAGTKVISSSVLLPLVVDILKWNVNIFNTTFKLLDILFIIWAAGFLAKLFKSFRFYYQLNKCVSIIPETDSDMIHKCVDELKAKYKFKHPIKVIKSSMISSPAEFGFFKQTILIPDVDYTYEELIYILGHEIIHFINKTNWTKLILLFFRSFLWWSPIVKHFVDSMESFLEINCDLQITSINDRIFTLQYIQCLIKHNQTHNNKATLISSFAHENKNNSTLKRIDVLINKNRQKHSWIFAAYFTIIMFFFLSYGFVFQTAYLPTVNDLDLGFEVESDKWRIEYTDEGIIVINEEMMMQ